MIGRKAHQGVEERLIVQGKFDKAVVDEMGGTLSQEEMRGSHKILVEIQIKSQIVRQARVVDQFCCGMSQAARAHAQ